jgi:ubiquinone/menaquinone biosynthesis C-methylase UbiE
MATRSDSIDPADTLRAYDQWATHYDVDDNPLVAATGLCLRARPLEAAGMRVVELGCGTGRNAPAVLAAGALAYTGVDGSAGMLAEARRRVNDARARWIEAELAQLPPPAEADGLHDAALIVLVLEHLTELDGVFAALARWLRPGGALRILELHPDRIAAGTVAHFHDEHGVEHRFTSTAHPVAALGAALVRSGFTVEWVVEELADEMLIAAVPRLAKHQGKPVVLDVLARRG